MNDESGGSNEASEQEFLAFGWQRAQINAPDTGSGKRLVEGFRHGDFAAYDSPAGWEVVALPADMLLGRLPSGRQHTFWKRRSTTCFPAWTISAPKPFFLRVTTIRHERRRGNF